MSGSTPSYGGREDLDRAALAYHSRAADSGRPEQAREEFLAFTMPFAGRLARRYRGRGEPLEDLEQVARLGLVKAVDRYDPARGSFTAYAAVTIVGELKRHFRDRTWGVHVPRRLRDLTVEVGQATAELAAELSRAPTETELAQRLEISVDELREARESAAGYSPASLNAPVGDGGAELADLVGVADDGLDSIEDRICLGGLLSLLPARERRILALRFYGNKTQAEIAEVFGISQMHVSRLLSRTLTWLRRAMLADVPPPFGTTGEAYDPQRLQVTVSRAPGSVVLAVEGEVDRDCAGHLRQSLASAIATAGIRDVVVDLAKVPLVDAAGAAVLVGAVEAATRTGLNLRVVNAQPYVRRVLAVAELISPGSSTGRGAPARSGTRPG